jgi:hypothetical protein
MEKQTVEHVMTGKAYKRAIRGQMLVSSVLTLILMKKLMPETAVDNSETCTIKLHDESVVENLKLSLNQVSDLQNVFKDVMLRKVHIAGDCVKSDIELLEGRIPGNLVKTNNSLVCLDANMQELFKILLEQSRTAKL